MRKGFVILLGGHWFKINNPLPVVCLLCYNSWGLSFEAMLRDYGPRPSPAPSHPAERTAVQNVVNGSGFHLMRLRCCNVAVVYTAHKPPELREQGARNSPPRGRVETRPPTVGLTAVIH
ncbi:unnamed protein product [Arctogadus glacialis]